MTSAHLPPALQRRKHRSQFTEDNFLTLNATKCEIAVFDKAPTRNREESRGNVIPVNETTKCLGALEAESIFSAND